MEEEYALISENIDNLNGVNTKLDWERIYLYEDVFKSIFGSVSSNSQGIPSELAVLLKNGYKDYISRRQLKVVKERIGL